MEETEPMPKEKKGNWHEDPVRRAEVLEKMRQGRERYYEERRQKAEQAPPLAAGSPAEGEPDYFALMRGLKGTRWDRMPLDLAESLMGIVDEARREGMGRIQARRERETTNRCSYCHDLFPNGRFAQQASWLDLESQQPISRLACHKMACRNALVTEQDRERRRRLEARG